MTCRPVVKGRRKAHAGLVCVSFLQSSLHKNWLGGVVTGCNAMLFKYEHVTSSRRDEWMLLHDSGQARKAIMHSKDAPSKTTSGASMPFLSWSDHVPGMPSSKLRFAKLQRFARAMVFCNCALAGAVSFVDDTPNEARTFAH